MDRKSHDNSRPQNNLISSSPKNLQSPRGRITSQIPMQDQYFKPMKIGQVNQIEICERVLQNILMSNDQAARKISNDLTSLSLKKKLVDLMQWSQTLRANQAAVNKLMIQLAKQQLTSPSSAKKLKLDSLAKSMELVIRMTNQSKIFNKLFIKIDRDGIPEDYVLPESIDNFANLQILLAHSRQMKSLQQNEEETNFKARISKIKEQLDHWEKNLRELRETCTHKQEQKLNLESNILQLTSQITQLQLQKEVALKGNSQRQQLVKSRKRQQQLESHLKLQQQKSTENQSTIQLIIEQNNQFNTELEKIKKKLEDEVNQKKKYKQKTESLEQQLQDKIDDFNNQLQEHNKSLKKLIDDNQELSYKTQQAEEKFMFASRKITNSQLQLKTIKKKWEDEVNSLKFYLQKALQDLEEEKKKVQSFEAQSQKLNAALQKEAVSVEMEPTSQEIVAYLREYWKGLKQYQRTLLRKQLNKLETDKK